MPYRWVENISAYSYKLTCELPGQCIDECSGRYSRRASDSPTTEQCHKWVQKLNFDMSGFDNMTVIRFLLNRDIDVSREDSIQRINAIMLNEIAIDLFNKYNAPEAIF